MVTRHLTAAINKMSQEETEHATLQIKYPNEELYTHYQGQVNPQDLFLELNIDTGVLSADYNPEIGNSVSMSVWNGIIRRYQLNNPYLSKSGISQAMDDVAELCQKVLDGARSRWNNQNWIGKLNEAAQDAEIEIEQILLNTEYPMLDIEEDED